MSKENKIEKNIIKYNYQHYDFYSSVLLNRNGNIIKKELDIMSHVIFKLRKYII